MIKGDIPSLSLWQYTINELSGGGAWSTCTFVVLTTTHASLSRGTCAQNYHVINWYTHHVTGRTTIVQGSETDTPIAIVSGFSGPGNIKLGSTNKSKTKDRPL